MFKWLVRTATRAVHDAQQEIENEKKNKEAYEKGQQAARAFNAAVDAYTGPRFEQLQTNFMKVLNDRLDLAAADQEVPPLVSARVEHRVFLDNVNKLKPHLTEETLSACKEWMDVWVQLGNESEMKQLIERKIDDFTVQMLDVSLKELLSRVDVLKPLDDAWRAANPDKSAQYPPPS
jgi:hypothetical protein